MTPTIQLHCDSCEQPRFVYQLGGTDTALCSDCFIRTYAPESVLDRRARRVRASGPAAAGCLRTMRVAPAVTDVHRYIGRSR